MPVVFGDEEKASDAAWVVILATAVHFWYNIMTEEEEGL